MQYATAHINIPGEVKFSRPYLWGLVVVCVAHKCQLEIQVVVVAVQLQTPLGDAILDILYP